MEHIINLIAQNYNDIVVALFLIWIFLKDTQ
jgi:hypothetical protein